MTLASLPGRAAALAVVVAGIVLLTLAVQGMTRVDTRLEVAAAGQAVPQFADCPYREHPRDREQV